jgi:hypothetical protein
METAAEQQDEGLVIFQIVQLTIDEAGLVIARKELQPLFQLREHAMGLAEFDAARTSGEYGYDPDRDCWWARDGERLMRFVVEPVAEKIAA